MNSALLLAQFERIVDASNAVPRLREFFLDLAVRGRLVRQHASDSPAQDLWEGIQAARGHAASAKKKRRMMSTPLEAAQVPFAPPPQWIWVPFGTIHEVVRGVTYTKADVAEARTPDHLPILRANNIGRSPTFDDPVFVRRERVKSEQLLRRGDYLVAMSSGSKNLVGKAAFVAKDYEGGFGAFCGVVRLHEVALEPYAGVFLSSRLYRDAIAAGSRGIGINNLKRETLDNLVFPLPPLAEQARIVKKVDELMTLCDRLEIAQEDRDSRRDRFAEEVLRRVVAVP